MRIVELFLKHIDAVCGSHDNGQTTPDGRCLQVDL